jgi:hypothetical protein
MSVEVLVKGLQIIQFFGHQRIDKPFSSRYLFNLHLAGGGSGSLFSKAQAIRRRQANTEPS